MDYIIHKCESLSLIKQHCAEMDSYMDQYWLIDDRCVYQDEFAHGSEGVSWSGLMCDQTFIMSKS